MPKKKQRQPLSDDANYDPRKLYVGTYKASWWQMQEIDRLATACGETASTYVVMCALNYHPKRRMTNEEIEALQPLKDNRKDIRQFFNGLEGLSRDERLVMLSRHSVMREWCGLLMKQYVKVDALIRWFEQNNEHAKAAMQRAVEESENPDQPKPKSKSKKSQSKTTKQ